MNLEKYIKNDTVFIIPANLKSKLIIYLDSFNKMFNIKIYTLNEVKKHLLFDYDEQAIYYLIKNYHLTYNNATEYLNNIYYLLDNNYNNSKLNNLLNIKNNLLENNLLYTNKFFLNSLKNKNIIVYGFDYLNKYNTKLIDIIKKITSVTIIQKKDGNYTHPVLEFNNINNEIEYIINDIINHKLDLNHVFIANIQNDIVVKRIFNNYNININLDENSTLFDIKESKDFLDHLNLDKISNSEIKDSIINVLNKYYFIDDKIEIKSLLINEFKKTKVPEVKYLNAINTIDLKDNIISDEDYIYLVDFNNNIPHSFKDEDYINDSEKPDYLEKTSEKNNLESNAWKQIISNIKNLTITFADEDIEGALYPSPLIDDYNYDVKKINYLASRYSNFSNKYNLGLILDDFIKFNTNNNEMNKLINTYPNINYLTYSNIYKKIDEIKKDIHLSYSKMNTYYECAFKYYCDNILRLSPYESTYDEWLGQLCHYILSKIYNDNFNFENEKNDFIKDNPFNLTKQNEVFMNKILKELQTAIKYILNHYNSTKYKEIECEKEININNDKFAFKGVIDKIMKKDNNIVLVDYKTGDTDIDLKLADYGLNLQLPTYIYLVKSIYPKSNIIGIYLEHIVKPMNKSEFGKSSDDFYENNLKLTGYTLGNENLIEEFDPTYQKSEFIKGMSLSKNGFSKNAKLLTQDQFLKLEQLTERKINECVDNIKNANFEINPKIKGTDNISCKYCKYKSVCFISPKDEIIIKQDKDLTFLGGDN